MKNRKRKKNEINMKNSQMQKIQNVLPLKKYEKENNNLCNQNSQ